MGYTRWSDDAYSHLKSSRTNSSTNDIFVNNKKGLAPSYLLPSNFKYRESRDSDIHPDSLSIAVFLDVTGSMGRIPDILVREKLGNLMNTLISNGIEHPQILFGAIGDQYSDRYPIQVSQFESGTDELDKSLTELYLEGGGGGQNKESYLLSWLVCARQTSIDCFEKRNQKGFLFTIGDEANWDKITRETMLDKLGYKEGSTISDKELLKEAQRMYHVFHIHINEASYRDDPQVLGYWKKLLGERLIVLQDYNMIAETIASTVALVSGVDMEKLYNTLDNNTSKVVKDALIHVKKSSKKIDAGILKL